MHYSVNQEINDFKIGCLSSFSHYTKGAKRVLTVAVLPIQHFGPLHIFAPPTPTHNAPSRRPSDEREADGADDRVDPGHVLGPEGGTDSARQALGEQRLLVGGRQKVADLRRKACVSEGLLKCET